MSTDRTTPSLDALLKIAKDTNDAPADADVAQWDAYIDTFHPTVAQALVRVAMAARDVLVEAVHEGDAAWNVLEAANSDLAVALKEGK